MLTKRVFKNIFSNFTSNKLVIFDDRDPSWMKDYVKGKVKCKNLLYKTYDKIGTNAIIIFTFRRQQI